MIWFFLLLSGFFSGILGAMGMGGGTILVPILTLFMGIDQHFAQGINLIVFIPLAIVAVVFHLKNRLIDFKAFLLLCIPAILSAALFANLSINIEKGTLRVVFGVFLIFISVFEFVYSVLKARHANKSKRFTEKLGI